MRDLLAGLIALLLLFVAAALATALQRYQKQRAAARGAERTRGRSVVAEVPADTDLRLFSEDERCFYYGEHVIDKPSIHAVSVLINGAPINFHASSRFPRLRATTEHAFEDRPEGIARDRWDVVIETSDGMTKVECGAIRERVSQELARKIYDAVKQAIQKLENS